MSSDERPISPPADTGSGAAAHGIGLEETGHGVEPEPRTPRQLAWRRFRKNRLAVASGIVVVLFYLMAMFAEFLSPYHHDEKFTKLRFAPPQRVHFFDEDGRLSKPFTYALKQELDLETFALTYQEQKDTKYYVQFFVRGEPYRWLGMVPMQLHLFGVEEGGSIFLFGTDTLGRDLLSRILIGSQVSLSVPLVGTLVTIIIGTILGIASGYFGRMIDHALQRFIEVLISFPRVPLWLAFSAAIPATWPSGWVYMGIVVAISLIGWGGLARVVRGKVLAYRNEEYVLAAEGVGAGNWRIISKHLLPGSLSHIIVVATLSVPELILAESSLSFLGVGVTPPMTSWGILLQGAQSVQALLHQPWLGLPAIFIIVIVLAFNFLGDGVRDAADPFAT